MKNFCSLLGCFTLLLFALCFFAPLRSDVYRPQPQAIEQCNANSAFYASYDLQFPAPTLSVLSIASLRAQAETPIYGFNAFGNYFDFWPPPDNFANLLYLKESKTTTFRSTAIKNGVDLDRSCYFKLNLHQNNTARYCAFDQNARHVLRC